MAKEIDYHKQGMKVARKLSKKEDKLTRLKHEIRIDTLTGLRQMAAEGIILDVHALDEMIDEIQKATTPIVRTPKELAKVLGIKDKKVRDKLRMLYPDHPKHTDWILTPEMTDAVRLALQD